MVLHILEFSNLFRNFATNTATTRSKNFKDCKTGKSGYLAIPQIGLAWLMTSQAKHGTIQTEKFQANPFGLPPQTLHQACRPSSSSNYQSIFCTKFTYPVSLVWNSQICPHLPSLFWMKQTKWWYWYNKLKTGASLKQDGRITHIGYVTHWKNVLLVCNICQIITTIFLHCIKFSNKK